MTKSQYSLMFSVGVLLVMIWMAWEASSFVKIASYFPLYIALFAIVLILVDLTNQIIKMSRKKDSEKKVSKKTAGSVFRYILWFVGYLLLMLLIGFLIGTSIFLFLFLMIESKMKIAKVLMIIALTIMAIMIFGYVMDLRWPIGVFGI